MLTFLGWGTMRSELLRLLLAGLFKKVRDFVIWSLLFPTVDWEVECSEKLIEPALGFWKRLDGLGKL